MTQAPRRLFDASSTGSSGSVQLFARLETSPCALSGCIPIHESNPGCVWNPSSLHEETATRTERTFTLVVLCGKITPSLFRGEKGAAFVSDSFVGNACWKITAINPATSTASRVHYRGSLGTCLTKSKCLLNFALQFALISTLHVILPNIITLSIFDI